MTSSKAQTDLLLRLSQPKSKGMAKMMHRSLLSMQSRLIVDILKVKYLPEDSQLFYIENYSNIVNLSQNFHHPAVNI